MNLQPIRFCATLQCHPVTPSRWVRGIVTDVLRKEHPSLSLVYRVEGDAEMLRVPAASPPRRTDGLWQHTCFEIFVAATGQPCYWEFNFSPSGEWAAYKFDNYRDGGTPESQRLNPEIAVRSGRNYFELKAALRLDRLEGLAPHARLRLGISAVIEDVDGAMSYWALKHPLERPDFHQPDSFALELAVPDESA